MALFFITGNSGVGKTTLMQELRSRGYEAYDTDDDGFAKWTHKKTGYAHPKSSITPEIITAEFLKDHIWKVPVDEIKKLVGRAKDKSVFLCGFAANEEEIKDSFKRRFALIMDDDTLIHRVKTRTNNDWGKQPQELKKILGDQAALNKRYQSSGHIIIDATLPLETVLDTILKNVKELESNPVQ